MKYDIIEKVRTRTKIIVTGKNRPSLEDLEVVSEANASIGVLMSRKGTLTSETLAADQLIELDLRIKAKDQNNLRLQDEMANGHIPLSLHPRKS